MCDFTINDSERAKRAEKGRKLVRKITVRGQEATYQGSAQTPFKISLDKCGCGDWIRRHQPCKHMYALAFRLNILQ